MAKEKNIAKVSNSIIESFVKKNNLTAVKLLFYIAKADIARNDAPIVKISIDSKHFCEYCQLDLKTLRENILKMQQVTFTFRSEKPKRIKDIVVIPKAEYFIGEGKIEIEIYKEILDLIGEVKNKFTMIDVKQLMNFNSKHSVKMIGILEMINGFDENVPKRKYYDLNELNGMFDTKYKRILELERKIFIPAKKELDANSKLSFIYQVKYEKEDAKAGRPKAVGIIIDLVRNTPQGVLF